MDYVRREVEECKLVEEAIDPDGIEGFGHVEEDRLLASFRRSSWLFFRRGEPAARTCYVWV
jgi:hypothetical protein